MTAHRFSLHVPESVGAAVAIAAEHGSDAMALAGGTVLIPEVVAGRRRPRVVVDLRRSGLDGVGSTFVGATATYRALSSQPGLLGAMAKGITGGAQLRNWATIGGSLAFANPSSDAPAVVLALEATVVARSARGERRLAAGDFFLDAFRTALAADELLIGFEFPPGDGFGYHKLKFGESSWPVVTAAASRRDGRLRVAVGGAAAVPFVVAVESVADVEEAIHAALAEPWSDVLASADYRRRVAPLIARRAAESIA